MFDLFEEQQRIQCAKHSEPGASCWGCGQQQQKRASPWKTLWGVFQSLDIFLNVLGSHLPSFGKY